MSKEKRQRALVPRLRFPEFRDANAWQEVALRKVATVIAGQSPRGEYYNDTGEGIPFYQGKTDFGDVFINPPTKWTTQVTKLANKGDILMSVRAPVGALNVSTKEICIGRGLASLQAKEDRWFLYYLLLQVNHLFVGNGGSVFDSINKSQIESTKLPFPPIPAEQQKIADCLGSLDDLIAAEGRKLAALRDHKKELMQQLFPREGETRPRLRFPEFENAREWDRFQLERLEDERRIELGRGKVISHDDMRAKPGPYPVYSSSVIDKGLMGAYGDYLFDEELVSWSVDGGGHFFYRPKHKFSVTNVSGFIRVLSDDIVCQFLAYQLQRLHASETFNYVQKAHPSVIRTLYTVGLPSPDEQNRIADCLSALDATITAQAEKLNALRTHKRGLMQQLFPSPEDVEA